MAMKGYSIFPYHQMVLCHLQDTCWVEGHLLDGPFPSAEMLPVYSTNPSERALVSFCVNGLRKAMNQIVLHPTHLSYGWIERKHWIQTSYTPLKNWPCVTSCLLAEEVKPFLSLLQYQMFYRRLDITIHKACIFSTDLQQQLFLLLSAMFVLLPLDQGSLPIPNLSAWQDQLCPKFWAHILQPLPHLQSSRGREIEK